MPTNFLTEDQRKRYRQFTGMAEKRLWATLAAAPTPQQAQRLQQMVVVPGGRRVSELDRLRRSPRDISPRGVVEALERYDALKTFGGPTWDLSAIPPGRIQALVRFAKAARAQAVAELGGHRRLATLVAFAAVMPSSAAQGEVLPAGCLAASSPRNPVGAWPSSSVTRVIFGSRK
ncbi:hypothetical protein ND748_09955 [Frankia sp. AiPs1]|uniref:hypothetical protein n=1 Tax=Frankia sp. AiPs1 TaxID=573493 RepID=UPI002044C4B6|nr:hypothetical protein [Frankia sp. AiPs1]MCM3921981.1 hypothetical protein [Frankia sp. AiPs1]